MVTIIADEGKNQFGTKLYTALESKGVKTDYVSLEKVEVKPCISCNGCTGTTYGKCVFRDDGDWIYPKVLRSDAVVFVSPIVFGSYSFKLKRVFDKIVLVMDRHYFVERNELVKGGLQGKPLKLFVVGVKENCLLEEEDAFKRLVHENHLITRGSGKAYAVDSVSWPEKRIVADILEKVFGREKAAAY